jgi:Uma2 family endonuclease
LAKSGGLGDLRVELRRGMIVEMSPQFAPHATLKFKLALAALHALNAQGRGWQVLTEVSVDWPEQKFQPMPDIVVWDPAAVSGPLEGPIPGAAVRLVIEVAASTLADDLGEKLKDYAAANLAEYWVADVAAQVLHQHAHPGAEGYAQRQITPLHQAIAALSMPDLVLHLIEKS